MHSMTGTSVVAVEAATTITHSTAEITRTIQPRTTTNTDNTSKMTIKTTTHTMNLHATSVGNQITLSVIVVIGSHMDNTAGHVAMAKANSISLLAIAMPMWNNTHPHQKL